MIYRGLELHNVEEVVTIDDCAIFSRLPTHVNETLQHHIAYQFTSAEIRFVPLGNVVITLASKESFIQPKCLLYYGDFQVGEECIIHRERTFVIEPLKKFDIRIREQASELYKESVFSMDVVRMVLHGEGFYIKDIQGAYRLPNAEEKPTKRMLSYGTSITQGIGATSPDMSYPWMLARRLGMDAYNYALSGKCLCEHELTDFLIQSRTYDVITLELSVNMLALGYGIEVFQERATYLIDCLHSYNPQAHIVCIGILPYWQDYGFKNPLQTPSSTSNAYRTCLQTIVKTRQSTYIHYIDGRDLLSIHNLSSDLIHPSNQGMIEIANKLYEYIKKY